MLERTLTQLTTPARFVTYSFIYLGVLFLLHNAVIFGVRLELSSIAYLVGGITFLGIGLYRRFAPTATEEYPEEYGPELYLFGVLVLGLTGLFVVQLDLA